MKFRSGPPNDFSLAGGASFDRFSKEQHEHCLGGALGDGNFNAAPADLVAVLVSF
jgi:hypothetical protein